jgi:fucose 4-O-acetylase-like acetyltransferase
VRINPTLRGFVIIAAIAAVILVLQLEATLSALFYLARIAFLLAIAFFLYLVWRDHKVEIGTWSTRARVVFYGSAALIAADVLALTFVHESGLDAVAFVIVLAVSAFAMWRVWRDQHTYA